MLLWSDLKGETMKFLKRLTLAYHVIVGLFLLTLLVLFLTHQLSLTTVLDLVYLSYTDHSLRLVWAVVLAISLIFNFLLFRLLSRGSREHRVILFENPAGKIRVSIFALEELAKRVASSVEEVRDVQARVELDAKALDVDLKLTLRSDANILEVTSRIQNLVRRRIQETISLEQTVNVSAYVSKIEAGPGDPKSIKGTTKNPYTDLHPFQGYRA